jgi:hypothetical protein
MALTGEKTRGRLKRTGVFTDYQGGRRYPTIRLDYSGCIRYPRLENMGEGETSLDRLLEPRTSEAQFGPLKSVGRS